ncbi:MAG: aspartate aminotransferase family protein [Rhodothermales bacterium]|nr:aspartate aminotransferase family protein [Rhodothermales bacterium]
MDELLEDVSQRVREYLSGVSNRSVAPSTGALEGLSNFDFRYPETGRSAREVIHMLDRHGSPATVASAGPRYFGFVVGGALPVTVAANHLVTAWDQLSGLYVASPVVGKIESVAEKWLADALSFQEGTAAGFVTGATMANFSGLVTARSVLLKRQGWDAEEDGLFGAPELTVVVGDEYHASMKKALSLVGFGRSRVVRAPVDTQGRIIASSFPETDENTIVCLQAGNVNTGAFDPLEELVDRARSSGSWVHVDAAFGLWARVSDRYKHLTDGIENADSVATDAHKWLNVPYDSGIIFVRDRQAFNHAMSSSAAYLIEGERRDGYKYAPEMSRRPRGIEVWAALLSLGRSGLAELVERNCAQAARFAAGLQSHGFKVLNDVVLNQVLVSFGESDRTKRVIEAVQNDGTMWVGGTEWQGQTAMRISVSSWLTSDEDIDMCIDAIARIVREEI